MRKKVTLSWNSKAIMEAKRSLSPRIPNSIWGSIAYPFPLPGGVPPPVGGGGAESLLVGSGFGFLHFFFFIIDILNYFVLAFNAYFNTIYFMGKPSKKEATDDEIEEHITNIRNPLLTIYVTLILPIPIVEILCLILRNNSPLQFLNHLEGSFFVLMCNPNSTGRFLLRYYPK